MPKQTEKEAEKQTKENPHVHRFTSYIKTLETNWAYVNTKKTPGFKNTFS
jgi:hypothetical protein